MSENVVFYSPVIAEQGTNGPLPGKQSEHSLRLLAPSFALDSYLEHPHVAYFFPPDIPPTHHTSVP